MNQVVTQNTQGTGIKKRHYKALSLIPVLWAIYASLLFVSTPANAYQAKLVSLLKQGEQQQAYQWLLKHQTDYAHDPQYNEWLADLALKFENYPLAINALERLVLLTPNHLGARLDLAIAYYEAGDLQDAEQRANELRREFESRDDIPQPAILALEQLLEQIATQRASNKPYKIRGLAQLTGAFDSNANLGPRDSTVMLNLQGAIPFELELAPESLETSDYFIQERAQIALEENQGHCFYDDWCATLVADISNRNYNDLTQYDQQQLFLAGYLNQQNGPTKKRWLGYMQYSDQKGFDTETTLALEYTESAMRFNHQTGYVLHGDVRNGSPGTEGQQLSLSLFANDKQHLSYLLNFSYLNRPNRAAGSTWRVQGSSTYSRRLLNFISRTSLGVNWQKDTDPYSFLLFGPEPKNELEVSLSTSATWRLSTHWGLTLRASHSRTSSNIPLLEHNRTEASAVLTYLW